MAIGGDDISNDVTTLVFQSLFAFALPPLRADWRKFDAHSTGRREIGDGIQTTET